MVKLRQDRGGVLRDTITTYDGQGRVTRIATPEGAVNHEYDDLGRLSRSFTTTTAGTDPIDDTRYGYDALSRLASVTVYERNDVAFAAGSRETTTYDYDLVGNLKWEVRPDRVLVDYVYDALNRLDVLTQYVAGTSPQYPEFFDFVARYDYDVRADGRRAGVTETTMFDSGGGYPEPHTTTITWDYDDLGRLIDESIDHYVNDLDRTEHFGYDLAGNRLTQTVDKGSDGATTPDEVTTYAYDANDRLTSEALDTDGVGPVEQTTTYGYGPAGHGATHATSKAVSQSGAATALTSFGYDLQGRMAVVTVTTYTGGVASRIERTTYSYGGDGIRTSALYEVDATADGSYETATRTEYLNDADNPTGYSQVVRETTTDPATGQVQKTIVYTLGHDQISQTTTPYTGGVAGTATTLVFGYDGHGSTRLLTDLAGAIATVAGVRQVLDYDAYGNLLGLTAAQPATSLLFSGEMLDAHIGQQHLRARWYDPATGRFNSLDSFFGDLQDPQSLHKYLYTHADPVNFIDPSGNETLAGMISAIGNAIQLSAIRVQIASVAYLGAYPTVAYFVTMAVNGLNVYSYAADPGAAMSLGPAALADDVAVFVIAAHQAGKNAFAAFRGLDMLGRGTGVMGRITKSILKHPRGSDAGIDPIGWEALVDWTRGDRTQRARGHLWAKLFGGPGTDFRNIVPLFKSANDQMEKIELAIRDILKSDLAEAVYYRVTPVYDDAFETALPVALDIEAVAVDALDNILETIAKLRIHNG